MPDATAPQQAPIAVHLLHLGLPVRDQRRSLRFYQTYFGFEPASARHYPDGTVIVRNADGFDLALHAGVLPDQPAAFLHLGFQLRGAAAVLAKRTTFCAAIRRPACLLALGPASPVL